MSHQGFAMYILIYPNILDKGQIMEARPPGCPVFLLVGSKAAALPWNDPHNTPKSVYVTKKFLRFTLSECIN